jgi:hypothetical protein
MFISGDVGIGHTSPVTDLHIVSSGDPADDSLLPSYALVLGKSSDDADTEVGMGFRISSDQGVGHSPGAAVVFERKDTNSKGDLHFKMRNSTSNGGHILTRMTLDHDGRLGIGTTDPKAGLHIDVDSGGSTSPQLLLDGGGNSNGDLVVPDSEILQIGHWDKSAGSYTHRMSMGGTGEFIVNSTTVDTDEGMFQIKQSADDHNGGGLTIIQSAAAHAWTLWHSTAENLNFSYNGSSKGYLNDGANVSNIDFTGQHRCTPSTSTSYSALSSSVGKIVISDGTYSNLSNEGIAVNEAIPRVKLSDATNQKSVFGVISDAEDENTDTREYTNGIYTTLAEKSDSSDNRIYINSLGEGGIWITNINGNIENGDYLTTCEIPGYGMKQDDDLLHNYTVAKITQDCLFDLNSTTYECEEIQHDNTTYRAAFVGCTYHCG